MPTEITVQENEEPAVELRSLFKKRDQSIGDVNRWKDAPGLDIALLRYLGRHLDATTLERLKKEPEAWKATVAASYFIRKAEETGNNELKDNLLQLLKDPNIKARDIGLYATRGIEGTLESENLEEILDEKEPKKTQFRSEKNTIDIMFLPISKNSYHMYIAEPRLKKNLENLKVNIHAPDIGNEEDIKYALQLASSYIKKEYSRKHKKLAKELKECWIIFPSMLTGCGLLAGTLIGIFENNMTAAVSLPFAGLSLGALVTGLTHLVSKPEFSQIKRMKKAGKMMSKLDIQSATWVQNDYLANVYEAACDGKYFSRHEADPLAHRARNNLLKSMKKGKVMIAPEFQINYTGRKEQDPVIYKK